MIPSGELTFCYWKWPSRNSGFSHWKWWIVPLLFVGSPEGKHSNIEHHEPTQKKRTALRSTIRPVAWTIPSMLAMDQQQMTRNAMAVQRPKPLRGSTERGDFWLALALQECLGRMGIVFFFTTPGLTYKLTACCSWRGNPSARFSGDFLVSRLGELIDLTMGWKPNIRNETWQSHLGRSHDD